MSNNTQPRYEFIYNPPLTPAGDRDWRKELDVWKRNRNSGNAPLDITTIVVIDNLLDALDAARKERDDARRYSCDLEARIIVLEEDRRDTSNKFGTNPCSEIILPDYPLAREPKEIAKQKGWDCFKDNA